MKPPLYNGRLQARRESCKEEMRDYVRQMVSLKCGGWDVSIVMDHDRVVPIQLVDGVRWVVEESWWNARRIKKDCKRGVGWDGERVVEGFDDDVEMRWSEVAERKKSGNMSQKARPLTEGEATALASMRSRRP